MRTYDFEDFSSNCIQVRFTYPVDMIASLDAMNGTTTDKRKDIELWLAENCNGLYLVMFTVVIFEEDADAIIFNLKYG